VSLADYTEKNRIWISSGDMPDITFSGLNYSDYKKFAEQGLIRALPADYEQKYPNMTRAFMATGGIDKALKDRFGGKLYCAPKPIFFNKIVDPFGEHSSIYFRKDWTQKVGLPVKDAYTIDELMALAKAFMDRDPNGNGAGKTIGLAIEPGNMFIALVRPYLSAWAGFFYKDGKYVWGPAQPEVLEGLKTIKKYYDQGIIYKDFFAMKVRSEVEAKLNAGLTGLMFNGGAFGNVKRIFTAFTKETKLDAMENLGLANIYGPDGKFHTTEFMNLQSVSYFNPKMESDKFDRILALLDYVATPEVQELINLGFKGKDFTKEGDRVTITRPKDAGGNFVPIANLYPSYYLWAMLIIAWDDFTVRDPSTDPRLLAMNRKMWEVRTTNGNMARVDYDLTFHSGPYVDKASSITVSADFTGMIVKEANIEEAWKKWVKEKEPIIAPALDELNKAIQKK